MSVCVRGCVGKKGSENSAADLCHNLGEAGLLEVAEVGLGEAAHVEIVALDVGDELEVVDEHVVGDSLARLDSGVVAAPERVHVCAEDVVDAQDGQRGLGQSRLVQRLCARLRTVAGRRLYRVFMYTTRHM